MPALSPASTNTTYINIHQFMQPISEAVTGIDPHRLTEPTVTEWAQTQLLPVQLPPQY